MDERASSRASALDNELRDLLCLAVVADHLRWVLIEDPAGELAAQLTSCAARCRDLAEEIATQLVALGVAPDGRVRSLARDISAHWVPAGWLAADQARSLIAHRLSAALGSATARRARSADPDTVRIFDAVCAGLEALRTDIGVTIRS